MTPDRRRKALRRGLSRDTIGKERVQTIRRGHRAHLQDKRYAMRCA